MNLKSTVIFLLIITISGCASRNNKDPGTQQSQQATELCQNSLVLDAHIDWPYRLTRDPGNISRRVSIKDFDLVRARTGGLDAPFSVVFAPPEYDVDEGRKIVDALIDSVVWYTKKYPAKCAAAKTPEELERNFSNGLISLPLCLENGSPIGDDLAYLEYLKEKGIAYITLTHSKTNQISDSNFDTNRKWKGLSPFGIDVIREMNRLGIMIDISHSTDSAVFQTLRYSKAPVIASHSTCRHFIPGYERALSDTLIKAIAAKNGVVMIAFVSDFLDPVCYRNFEMIMEWCDSTGFDLYSKECIAYIDTFAKTHRTRTDSKLLVDHIEHVVRLAGIDHVGLGSDYDGMGTGPYQPVDLIDVSCYPVIVKELLDRGYTEAEIRKVLSGNFLRVWREVLDVSRSYSTQL